MFRFNLLSDQIAFLAIYMLIIHAEVVFFIQTWNIHYIQKQKSHSHVIHEKLYMNYHLSSDEVLNYELSVDEEFLKILQKNVEN